MLYCVIWFMEKKLTNSDPLMELSRKHSIYTLPCAQGHDSRADREKVMCDSPSARVAGAGCHERINKRRPGASLSSVT
jgi:hypothetical protein